MPVVMKKVLGAADSALDYLFLAAAGNYGGSTNFNKLALHLGSGPLISTLAIPDTGWHHISVAFDPISDTVRFTLDDQVDTQTTTSAGTSNIGPVVVGAHFNSSGVIDSTFDGLIDELSITDGFLAEEELQPLLNVPAVTDFRITDFRWDESGDTLEITFQSTPSGLYNLEVSPDLADDSWEIVEASVNGSPGNTTTISGIPATGARAFYRVSTR